jgi:endonuclease/exonuclease/phosphatase family metal-dependent hydrolase
MMKHVFAAAGLLLFAAGPVAAQSPLTLTNGNATTLRAGSYANTNYGSASIVETRASDSADYMRRALFKFDTHTTIPQGTPIKSATLTVTVASGSDDETRTLSAYYEKESYDATAATWNRRKTSTGWSEAGGTLGSRYSSALITGQGGSKVSFDVTAMVAAVVRGDFDPNSRYTHILLVDEGASSQTSYKQLYSSNASDPSTRPVLTIVTGTTTSTTTNSLTSTTSAASTPYTGTPIAVPGRIEAENYDKGGAGVAYSDTTAGNSTGVYRSDDVDIRVTTDVDGKYNLKSVRGGEWLNYTVNVATTGSYTLQIRVASSGPGGTVHLNVDGANATGAIALPSTGGWNTWQTVTKTGVSLASGTHVVRLVIDADGSGGTAADINWLAFSAASSSSTSTSGTSTTLRVLQWNTHHGGYGTDGVYNPNRLATWAASFKPDVVMFNEIEKNDSWGNADDPEVYKALLEQKTGKTWYYVFAQEFGQWDSAGKGNLILSSIPFNWTTRYEVPNNDDRSVVAASITVNGRSITLIGTHLDPYDATLRLTQATEVVNWAAPEPENRILTGDMNAWPDQTSIAEYNTKYNDSWVVAGTEGTAVAFSGNTGQTKNGRIDYIYYSKSANLSVVSSQVYDTRDANGIMPSDHRPVLTVFTVK